MNESDDVLFDPAPSDDELAILQEIIYISSDDEDEDAADDFFIPRPTPSSNNQDPTQVVISTDASCNRLTAAGTCVILNDVTFGTQMRTLPHTPADSFIAELLAMTEAVDWGIQLAEDARSLGDSRITTIHVISDCKNAVQWWEAP